jgi:sigma-B regulation protein RsbU (phosphoserine phosphatase)
VLSGLSDEEIAIQAVKQGAQDYLLKGPAMEDVLPRAIRYALERHRSQGQLESYADELREKNSLLEEELRMAREIQQALIPGQYPQVLDLSGSCEGSLRFAHCYRPASGLSGDFFNVLHLPDNKVGLLICDVMGHGVRAALIGALARGLFDQLRPVAADPGKFLSGLNCGLSAILKHTGIDAFASAFYLVTDLATRGVRYANAGHPDALVLRRDSGVVDWLRVEAPHHPPLGLLGETTYRVCESALSKHDSLLLFTDGVYEEENAAGEQFGRQRLREAVNRRLRQPCETLLEDLVHDIQDFSGHQQFADDVCMVGMDVVNGQPSVSNAA